MHLNIDMPSTQTHSSGCSHYSFILVQCREIFHPCLSHALDLQPCKYFFFLMYYLIVESVFESTAIFGSVMQQCDKRIPHLMSKEQHRSWPHPLLMWMYEQVRPATESRAMSLSSWPTAPACAHSALCPQATTTTHNECPMCYITNERSNINVHHRHSEQAVNHSEFNVFQLRDHPESTPVKLCVFREE